MKKTIIDLDDFKGIDIPREIAVCPDCDADLYVSSIDEWSDLDGTIVLEHFSLDCKSEPDELGAPEWEEWIKYHFNMPYVDWLPLEEPVKKFLEDNYDFVMAGVEKEKLARWRKSVLGVEHE